MNMGLEAVIQDIEERGNQEVEAVRRQTQIEVDEILRTAHERVKELKTSAENEIQEHIHRITAMEESAASLTVKRQLLNVQKEVLDQVFQATLKSLADLPPRFHQEALSALLHQGSREVGSGIVSANERDFGAVKEIISRDKSLAGFTLGSIVNVEGGILIENAEKTMKIDLSYRTFLDKIWETGLKDAADILFA